MEIKKHEQISLQLEKEKQIKQEINRIKKTYSNLTKEKLKVIDGLIHEAAFIKLSLEELREDLMKNGFTELFEQGEQSFHRERPQCKIYTSFIQKYSVVMKQLIELMEVESKGQESDNLINFLKQNKISKR